MTKMSLSRAWDETRAEVARDGKLIATVALALFFLPGVILGVVEPRAEPVPTSGQDVLLTLVVALIALVGQLAIIGMALGARSTVGDAIRQGARRVPAYVLASLLWAGPLILLSYLIGPRVWLEPQNATGGQLLAALLVMFALVFIGVRMMMTSAVASVENANPLQIVKRSWWLTSGHWWRLFALLCLFLLAMIVVAAAVGAVVGILTSILFDPIEPMTVGALFVAACTQLVSAIFTTGLVIMLARIYAQLAVPNPVSVPSSAD